MERRWGRRAFIGVGFIFSGGIGESTLGGEWERRIDPIVINIERQEETKRS